MMLTPLLLTLSLHAGAPAIEPQQGIVAYRARVAETIANGTLKHAVILVENDMIVAVGQDLPIERGIPIIDLPDDWVVMPGLVSCQTRMGLDGSGYNDSRPYIKASDELFPPASIYADILESGVTTLGQIPAGSGIAGQAVAIEPTGDAAADMILRDSVYLKMRMRSTSTAKRYLTDGFKKADDWLEKEAKNLEKWEKAEEKRKKAAKSKSKSKDKDDDKDDDKKEDSKDEKKEEGSDEYKPLDPDPRAQAFLDLRAGELTALIDISRSGDYLHLLDAIGEEEFSWDLRVHLTSEIDLYHIIERVAEKGCRLVLDPFITLHPGTMRQRNLVAEFDKAGVPIALTPRSDTLSAHKDWLEHVGQIVAAGFDRDAALNSMTLVPAGILGIDERVGSIEAGKRANLIFLNGDPFAVGTKVKAVMIGGSIKFGEVSE